MATQDEIEQTRYEDMVRLNKGCAITMGAGSVLMLLFGMAVANSEAPMTPGAIAEQVQTQIERDGLPERGNLTVDLDAVKRVAVRQQQETASVLFVSGGLMALAGGAFALCRAPRPN